MTTSAGCSSPCQAIALTALSWQPVSHMTVHIMYGTVDTGQVNCVNGQYTKPKGAVCRTGVLWLLRVGVEPCCFVTLLVLYMQLDVSHLLFAAVCRPSH